MADDEDSRIVESVSDFLLKSCQRHTGSSPRLIFADIFRGVSYQTLHPVDGLKCKIFLANSGSAAEFHIQPMLSCVGDVDVMYHYSNELAVPAWHPPPSQLPADFDNRVKVYEIVDSPQPGYVYLSLIYILRRNACDNGYVVAEHVSGPNNTLNHGLYANVDGLYGTEIHGPAFKHGKEDCGISFLIEQLGQRGKLGVDIMVDIVPCVHCFMWPPQASDWPKRYRNTGWPDAATVDRVVRQGCDVVGVAHRQCRQDEWMGKHQWRLSFSRAEVVLLNSWVPVQQIVYHMLRVFVKTKRLTDRTDQSAINSETDTLSNYHIKTLMLWACEMKPKDWWNDGSSLVNKCVQLLQFLKEWITEMCGQHYFINNAHFLDGFDQFTVDTVSNVVSSVTEDILAQWFVDNYMRKCAEICPDNISLMCRDIPDEISDNTVNALLQWKDYVSGQSATKQVLLYILGCMLPSLFSFKKRPVDYFSVVDNFVISSLARNFEQIDTVELVSNLASVMLRFSNFIPLPQWLWRNTIIDVLAHCFAAAQSCVDVKNRLQCIKLRFSESCSVSPLEKAARLMELVACKRSDARAIACIEFSKVYLWRSFQCKDCEHDSTYYVANVYLAVLSYTTGQHQRAVDHCTLVTRLQDHTKCSLHVVQGNLLPKIDDDIDSVLGLVVFYQYVQSAALNQNQQKGHVGVFTTEIFAHYFSVKHLLVAKCRLMPKVQAEQSVEAVKRYLVNEVKLFYKTILSAPHLLVSDLMLCKLPNNTSVDTRGDCTFGSCGRRQLIHLMTESSMEQLLRYRHSTMPRDTVSIAVSDITDFMALYLYRCQLCERCELLCQQTIRDLINADINRIPLVSATYHEFVQLMDDDVVSLLGLMAMLNHGRPQSWSPAPITVTHLTLSLYLLVKCQIMGRMTTKVDPDTLSSLADILDWVTVAQKTIPVGAFVDHLLLKLVERKAVLYITEELNGPNVESFAGAVGIRLGYGWDEFYADGLEIKDGPLKIWFEIILEILDGNVSLRRTHSWTLAEIPP